MTRLHAYSTRLQAQATSSAVKNSMQAVETPVIVPPRLLMGKDHAGKISRRPSARGKANGPKLDAEGNVVQVTLARRNVKEVYPPELLDAAHQIALQGHIDPRTDLVRVFMGVQYF